MARLQLAPVADPWGFLGFSRTPLFVVLRACIAGVQSAVETFWTAEAPLSKS